MITRRMAGPIGSIIAAQFGRGSSAFAQDYPSKPVRVIVP